jgi:hypothetical protein
MENPQISHSNTDPMQSNFDFERCNHEAANKQR